MPKGCTLICSLTAVVAVVGLYAASPAPATVLCKTSSNPCSGGIYEAGTAIEANLGSEKAAFTPMGACKASALEMEVTNAGGEATNVSGTVILSFGNCSCPGSVAGSGNFSISYPEKLELSNFEMETPYAFNCMGVGCLYGTSVTSGLSATSGAQARIDAKEAHIPKISGPLGCGNFAYWEAEYLTSPASIYVEPE